jgi:DNA-binding PadR family transcriptional regulator
MPIHHAVLALLSEGESYGYELKARFETAIGPQWGTLNIGHVYQVLERLVRDDYATRERIEQDTRPDKYLYRLTDAGRAELQNWMGSAHTRSSGYRDELFLKLFAAARVGGSALQTVVGVQRQSYLSDLADLAELRRLHQGDPLVSLLIESAVLHTQADLKITELAEQRLANYQPAELTGELGGAATRPGPRTRTRTA